MASTKDTYNELTTTLKKRADVEHAIAVLHWDKETYLPEKGAPFRSQQIATLSGIAHELFTDERVGQQLDTLLEREDQLDFDERRNVEQVHREYRRATRFSKEFVVRKSQIVSTAFHAWLEARRANDFKLYEKALADIVEISREEADQIGYEDHPYDALLDLYEPDAKTSELTRLFADVREQLVTFVEKIRQQPQINDDFLRGHYDRDQQWDFGLKLLKNMGYDFAAGRQDISEHPFTINFSSQDVRVTTRIDEQDFMNMTWSCIHEGGHALYEQGLPSEQYGLPLGQAVSLGIHESQSRLWENNVGRSRAYWQAHYGNLQQRFPDNLSEVSLDQFYAAINKIEPNLIRTEADELHYHFHVLIRFEIEKGLMEGALQATDLRDIWNEKYRAYLGVEVPDDLRGVLQDVHWSHGSIGYFPTYSLGSFYAAQFFAQAEKDLPGLSNQIADGDSSALLGWLRENIHQHGRRYGAAELCQRITGEPLNFRYFMDYAQRKFGTIYGL